MEAALVTCPLPSVFLRKGWLESRDLYRAEKDRREEEEERTEGKRRGAGVSRG